MEQPKYPHVVSGENPQLVLSPTEAVPVMKIQRTYVSEPDYVSIIMDSGKSFQIRGATFDSVLEMQANPFIESTVEIPDDTIREELSSIPASEVKPKAHLSPVLTAEGEPEPTEVDKILENIESWGDKGENTDESKDIGDSKHNRTTGTPGEQDSNSK